MRNRSRRRNLPQTDVASAVFVHKVDVVTNVHQTCVTARGKIPQMPNERTAERGKGAEDHESESVSSGSAHDVTAEDWQRRELRQLEDYWTVRKYPILGDGRRCMRSGKQFNTKQKKTLLQKNSPVKNVPCDSNDKSAVEDSDATKREGSDDVKECGKFEATNTRHEDKNEATKQALRTTGAAVSRRTNIDKVSEPRGDNTKATNGASSKNNVDVQRGLLGPSNVSKPKESKPKAPAKAANTTRMSLRSRGRVKDSSVEPKTNGKKCDRNQKNGDLKDDGVAPVESDDCPSSVVKSDATSGGAVSSPRINDVVISGTTSVSAKDNTLGANEASGTDCSGAMPGGNSPPKTDIVISEATVLTSNQNDIDKAEGKMTESLNSETTRPETESKKASSTAGDKAQLDYCKLVGEAKSLDTKVTQSTAVKSCTSPTSFQMSLTKFLSNDNQGDGETNRGKSSLALLEADDCRDKRTEEWEGEDSLDDSTCEKVALDCVSKDASVDSKMTKRLGAAIGGGDQVAANAQPVTDPSLGSFTDSKETELKPNDDSDEPAYRATTGQSLRQAAAVGREIETIVPTVGRRSSRLKDKLQKPDCEDFIYFPLRKPVAQKKPTTTEASPNRYRCVLPEETEVDIGPEVVEYKDFIVEISSEGPLDATADSAGDKLEVTETQGETVVLSSEAQPASQHNEKEGTEETATKQGSSDSCGATEMEGNESKVVRPAIKLIIKKASTLKKATPAVRRSSRLDGTGKGGLGGTPQALPDTPRTNRRQQITADHVNYARLMRHACTLWSSEQRRRFHQLNKSEHTTDMADTLRKEWDCLGEKERAKFFTRAKRADTCNRMDATRRNTETTHKEKTKDISETEGPKLPPEKEQTADDKEDFFNLDAERQNLFLKKRLLQIRRKMTPASYERFIEAFRNSLESTEKHLERQKIEITDYDAICRRLLFMKLYEIQSTLPECVPGQPSAESQLAAAKTAVYDDYLTELMSENLEFGSDEISGRLSEVLEVLETLDKNEDRFDRKIPKQRYKQIYHHLKSEAEPFEPHEVRVGNEEMFLQTITNPGVECATLCRSIVEPELPLLDEQDVEYILYCHGGIEGDDLVSETHLMSAAAALLRIGYLPQTHATFDDTSCALSSLLAMEMAAR